MNIADQAGDLYSSCAISFEQVQIEKQERWRLYLNPCAGGQLRSRSHIDNLQLGEFSQALFGEFRPYAGLFGTPKRNLQRHIGVLVHPHRPGVYAYG